MKSPLCAKCCASMLTKPSIYESLRNFLGLTPLRANCWTHCWMSDDASTEWKNYSLPRSNYVAWLPASMPYAVFRSTTLGMLSLFVSANQQYEMNTLRLRNVQRLRTSKSLTCDALKELLTSTPVSAMRRWSQFGFVSVGSRMFGRTSSLLSRSVSSSTAWSAENADIIQDILDFKKRIKEENDYGVWS